MMDEPFWTEGLVRAMERIATALEVLAAVEKARLWKEEGSEEAR